VPSVEAAGDTELPTVIRSLNLQASSPLAVADEIEQGLGVDALEALQETLRLSGDQMAEAIGISPRTLSRRRDAGMLTPEESDRLVQLGILFDEAVALFDGEVEQARDWFKHPTRALGGRVPAGHGQHVRRRPRGGEAHRPTGARGLHLTRIWRMCKSRHLDDAFDGEGARRYGGRWNSPGSRMVYTADSAALATLDILVNLEQTALLAAYNVVPADLDEEFIEDLGNDEMPDDWRQAPPSESTQRIGDEWIESESSVGLRVPSSVVPGENILLNPDHSRFREIEVQEPMDWDADPRLLPE
jgi:putative toxin-antitoxin system antitoxin component (TIGR02293 family)